MQAHDLIWLNGESDLTGDLPDWVRTQWRATLPLVIRRDRDEAGRLPVGIRGVKRDQRAAAWVNASAVCRRVVPETFSEVNLLLRSPFVSLPPVQAAIQLAQQRWPWPWGITGSVGYALATEMPVIHGGSDLDLTLRAPQRPDGDALARWQQLTLQLPCRVDTQIETPLGAFALAEWLRDGRAMLKTDRGPLLTASPWKETA